MYDILLRHEQVYLMRLRFKRYFSHHHHGDLSHHKNKFLDLVNLVLKTTWHTLNVSFINKLMELQWEDQHLQPQQKFICRPMPMHTDQCLHYSSHHQTSCKKSVAPSFNTAYPIIRNKDDSTKENFWIEQMLKVNGYQVVTKFTFSKLFKRITNNHDNKRKQQISMTKR